MEAIDNKLALSEYGLGRSVFADGGERLACSKPERGERRVCLTSNMLANDEVSSAVQVPVLTMLRTVPIATRFPDRNIFGI